MHVLTTAHAPRSPQAQTPCMHVLTTAPAPLSPQVTSEGVRPAREGESRVTVSCIHNATQHDERALLEMSTKTPAEMSKFLASPDVAVTNKKDKETMLPIVGETDKHVKEMMSGLHGR